MGRVKPAGHFRWGRVLLLVAIGVPVVLLGRVVLRELQDRQANPDNLNRGTTALLGQLGELVYSNRGDEVKDGFRGDVHPLLVADARLDVTIRWPTLAERSHPGLPEHAAGLLRKAAFDEKQHHFSAREFSLLLPEHIKQVGQIWAVNLDEIPVFLKHFHPSPKMHLASRGRKIANNGGYAILRASSEKCLDILFRIHAEFLLDDGVWYTPAHLSGRMIVNKEMGTVDYFLLENPPGLTLNSHVTVMATATSHFHDIVRCTTMEMRGGRDDIVDSIEWQESLDEPDARRQLEIVFYKFAEIEWVQVEQALSRARTMKRPIMAIVLEGNLDDQSC